MRAVIIISLFSAGYSAAAQDHAAEQAADNATLPSQEDAIGVDVQALRTADQLRMKRWQEYHDCLDLAAKSFSYQAEPAETVTRAVIAFCHGDREDWVMALDQMRKLTSSGNDLAATRKAADSITSGDHDFILSQVMAYRAERRTATPR